MGSLECFRKVKEIDVSLDVRHWEWCVGHAFRVGKILWLRNKVVSIWFCELLKLLTNYHQLQHSQGFLLCIIRKVVVARVMRKVYPILGFTFVYREMIRQWACWHVDYDYAPLSHVCVSWFTTCALFSYTTVSNGRFLSASCRYFDMNVVRVSWFVMSSVVTNLRPLW